LTKNAESFQNVVFYKKTPNSTSFWPFSRRYRHLQTKKRLLDLQIGTKAV